MLKSEIYITRLIYNDVPANLFGLIGCMLTPISKTTIRCMKSEKTPDDECGGRHAVIHGGHGFSFELQRRAFLRSLAGLHYVS